MKQGRAEAFKEPHRDDETEPESAVILHFPKTYEAYERFGGALRQEEYNEVLERVAVGKAVLSNSMSPAHARFMAQTAGITTLSPETIDIYDVLCHEDPYKETKNYHGLDDRELLAEALLMVGDKPSRDTLLDTKNYPHIVKPKS